MEKEPKFYLNTEYVDLMPKREPYVPRIEFDMNEVYEELSYGRFYFYDEKFKG